MNDWPPPDVDAPTGPSSVPVARPWWQRPLARGLLVAWVVGGLVAFVVISMAGSPNDGPEAVETAPTPTTAPVATAPPVATSAITDATPPPTTGPEVRSAPPVPAPSVSTEPPPPAALPPTTMTTTMTTLVVTLPPRTTIEITAPAPNAPVIDVVTRFDASGDDVANLNDEWVRFTNAGEQPLDLTNWIVRDDGLRHAHVFDPLTLEPGAAVTLYSGCGNPTGTARFFCSTDTEIWNNDGDVVSLFDSGGVLVSQHRG